MRKPQTWCDKGLLEDEPFLSAFKARQIASPPTRQCTGKDNDACRSAAIASEIDDLVVQAWLDLAFQPDPNEKRQRVRVREPGMSNLFVEFYWALSQDHNLAAAILQKECRRRGYGYISAPTANLTKRKKANTKRKRISPEAIGNNVIDEATKVWPPQRKGFDGHSPPKGVQVGGIPANAKLLETQDPFQTEHNSPMLPPPSDSQDATQVCNTLTAGANGPCQFESNSSILLLPPNPQNTAAVGDLPKKRKRRVASPDTRHVKHRHINGVTSDSKLSKVRKVPISTQLTDTSTIRGSESTIRFDLDETASPLPPKAPIPNIYDSQAAKGKQGVLGAATTKTSVLLANTELCQTPDGANSSQERFRSRKNLWKKREHLSQDRSKVNAGVSAFSSRPNPSVMRTVHNISNRKKCATTDRDAHHALEKQSPRQVNGIIVDKKVTDTSNKSCNVPNGPTSDQLYDNTKRSPRKFTGMRFKRINDSSKLGTPAPQINQSVLQSSDQCNTSAICDPPNIRKQRSSTPEVENLIIVSKEVSVGRAEQAMTSQGTKRRKIVQEETTAESVKNETIDFPAQKQFRRIKRMHMKQRPPKTEAPDRPLIQSETHPSTNLPPRNSEPKTTSKPRKRRASSSVDRQHKRQAVIHQEGPAPINIQPEPVKKKRGRPRKVKALSLTEAQPRISGNGIGVKDELINSSENWLVQEQEETFTSNYVTPTMENHAVDIFPIQKPPLDVNPPIWAQSRQEVCETFDWFRSYQGGVYYVRNMVKGYLLSAFSSKRDRFEHGGRLIISHGGGKSESFHTRKGQTTVQPATDQLSQDKSVRALLDNYRNQRPLVLLIDDKYVLFPYDLGARDMTYVVLGFYTIAHAWAEYQPANNETGHVVRYKFAFRWCDDQGSPWWLTDKETHLTSPSTSTILSFEPTCKRTPTKKGKNGGQGSVVRTTKVREITSLESKSPACTLCHMDSPRVYNWAWICLHPNCAGFWRDINGTLPPDNLEYDYDFLELMTSSPIPPDFGKLKPDLPSCLSTDGSVTNYPFTRGFHCNCCGRLSCRFKWEKWECMNCGYGLKVYGPARNAKDFWSNSLPIGYKDHFISKVSKIKQQPVRGFRHENGMGSIQSFILPGGRGKIHHIQPGTPLGRLEADDIFIEYQQQATTGVLKFRRWPLRSHKCRGALLTNYFSQNSGEPYQYVGGTANTVPFENAPGAVVRARVLIQKRIQQALEMRVEFNEVLSAAYMERQKMAFHSDNEIGLGPVVAGLSLGSPALMHFRIHVKHDPLREQRGNLLSFVLRHGDVLVMDGASIQEYYDLQGIPWYRTILESQRQLVRSILDIFELPIMS